MNELLKRGFNVYKILMKNKLAMSLMMLVSGLMMTIAALNGRGNDTKTLPTLITSAGVLFAFWAFYRFGYLKANYDKIEGQLQKSIEKRILVLQAVEALAYIIVTIAGIYLLLNESLVNVILNLMAGGFTVFNGVVGAINVIKRRDNRDYRWVIRLILTLFELVIGPYFIITSASIDISGFIVMGVLTTVAGIIEVISALTTGALKQTVEDGKEIVRTLKKDDKPTSE